MTRLAVIFGCFAALAAIGPVANAQRQRTVPGTGAGFGEADIQAIAANGIFDPRRAPAGPILPPQVTTSRFSLNGVIIRANHSAYAFFSGDAADMSRGYIVSDRINDFNVAKISDNTVTLVNPNNQQTYLLNVGEGFTRLGTNEWVFAGSASTLPVMEATGPDAESAAASPAEARLRAKRLADINGSTTSGAK